MVVFPPPASVSFKINYLEIAGVYGTAKEFTIVQPSSEKGYEKNNIAYNITVAVLLVAS